MDLGEGPGGWEVVGYGVGIGHGLETVEKTADED